jgi:hypothetical protein
MDYKKNCIQVRSPKTKRFEGDLVGSSLIVGAVVEAVLKLAYRPLPTDFPTPVSLQNASVHRTVLLKDVIPPGYNAPQKTWDVKVFPRDAELALTIVNDALSSLMSAPYNLEILTADHSNCTACKTAHDLPMATRLVGTSCLPVGSYSVEIRCREIASKTKFTWYETLTSEAMPLWTAQLAKVAECKQSGLRARILVLACMARPCHSGSASIHAAINYGSSQDGWAVLFGWRGFNLPSAEKVGSRSFAEKGGSTGSRSRSPAPRAVSAGSAALAVASVGSPAQQWEKLKAKLVAQGTYFKLVSFCKEVRPKLLHGQAKRDFIEGPNAWRLGPKRGTKLTAGSQWVEKSGRRGGVPASWVRNDALEQVFYKYYAKK